LRGGAGGSGDFGGGVVEQQRGPGWNPACDVATPKDGMVNLADVAVLGANWMVDCDIDLGNRACVPK
jgi:hypothetical protein